MYDPSMTRLILQVHYNTLHAPTFIENNPLRERESALCKLFYITNLNSNFDEGHEASDGELRNYKFFSYDLELGK